MSELDHEREAFLEQEEIATDRIAALEADVTGLTEAWAEAEASLQKSEAQTAAMRKALQMMYGKARRDLSGVEEYDTGHLCDDLLAALATDAGAKVAAVVEAAKQWDDVAEAVTDEKPVSKDRMAEVATNLSNAVRNLHGSKTDD